MSLVVPVLGLYDPSLVIVTIGGLPVRGLADQEGAVKLTTQRQWITTEGCDGEVIRRRVRAKRGQLQLIVMQSSTALDGFTAQSFVDMINASAVLPMAILDVNGNGNRAAWAERAWIDGPPSEVVFYPRPAPVVYTLELAELEVVLGALRRDLGGALRFS